MSTITFLYENEITKAYKRSGRCKISNKMQENGLPYRDIIFVSIVWWVEIGFLFNQ
jgi:hypothetical protein